mmetsp:Transcript_10247/g.28239  ORF Transcript_10247/g.28239 Transcript_10247/m.28239 type:complete len:245 (-) Transcript_10247:304-1038(-)|eukprot:CAMPEP_0168727038 /NCGR_PEP_ID=MMETSP0724-20121128/4974_1 /TAXON_ID=265536 /ORGANISM="Amphiprora sp., Strain CCMP467" /LENGTH=244 /DNA_ID=CAMNT_0008773863 /DNA_START=125 /DNA_END=859 /DNA_ORIENTATION=+
MPGRPSFVDNYFSIFKLWIPAVFASGAFVGSMYYSYYCESIRFEPNENNDLPSISLGPWRQASVDVENGMATASDSCMRFEFSDDAIDATWTTARAFSLITAIIGAYLAFDLWMIHCAGIISDFRWKLVAFLASICLTISQGLTFLLFHSNACDSDVVLQILKTEGLETSNIRSLYQSECSWDNGSTANVIGIVLWFCTGMVMLIIGPPRLPEHEPTRRAMEQAAADRGENETVASDPDIVVEA